MRLIGVHRDRGRFRAALADEEGKRRYRSLASREADAANVEALYAASFGDVFYGSPPPLDVYLDRYVGRAQVTGHTRAGYGRVAERVKKAGATVADLCPTGIGRYAERRRAQGAAVNTVLQEVSLMKCSTAELAEIGIVDPSCFRKRNTAMGQRNLHAKTPDLDAAAVSRLLSTLEGDVAAGCRMALELGLDSCEVCGLRAEDVVGNGWVVVRRSVSRTGDTEPARPARAELMGPSLAAAVARLAEGREGHMHLLGGERPMNPGAFATRAHRLLAALSVGASVKDLTHAGRRDRHGGGKEYVYREQG